MTKERLNKKNKFLIATILILLVVLSSCSKKEDTSKKAPTNAPSPTIEVTKEPEIIPTQPPVVEEKYEIPECKTYDDVKKLKEQNSDFVFWFHIPSTSIKPISYPIVQAKDNDFYLYKGFDKKYSKAGSIFLDYRCNSETLDGHNILYGHNMGDGSMFGNVLKYYQAKDGSFLKEHPYIYTYSESGRDVWQIFTIFETTTDEYYIKTNFDSPFKYFSFIKDFKDRSVFDVDVELKSDDDILTLSTCYKFSAKNGRLVISAVRVDSQAWENNN